LQIQPSTDAIVPICPFEIAKRHDITIEPKGSSKAGVSGFLMRVGNAFGIAYASHIQNEGFIRFTVAHELGHYFLPEHPLKLFPVGDGVHESKSGFVSGDPLERQADFFAGALLMPASLFRQAADRAGSGFAAIEAVASACKTSVTATAIRYAQFTEEPCAVIVSAGARIDYCFMSDRIRDLPGIRWIRKSDLVPSGTLTARFNGDPANIDRGRKEEGTSTLCDWLDGAPDIEVNEDVVGLGSYGRTLTVLFCDELEEEPEDDDGEEERD
jgi:hypothetical protein